MATIDNLLQDAETYLQEAKSTVKVEKELGLSHVDAFDEILISQAASLLVIARLLNRIVDNGIPMQRGTRL